MCTPKIGIWHQWLQISPPGPPISICKGKVIAELNCTLIVRLDFPLPMVECCNRIVFSVTRIWIQLRKTCSRCETTSVRRMTASLLSLQIGPATIHQNFLLSSFWRLIRPFGHFVRRSSCQKSTRGLNAQLYCCTIWWQPDGQKMPE